MTQTRDSPLSALSQIKSLILAPNTSLNTVVGLAPLAIAAALLGFLILALRRLRRHSPPDDLIPGTESLIPPVASIPKLIRSVEQLIPSLSRLQWECGKPRSVRHSSVRWKLAPNRSLRRRCRLRKRSGDRVIGLQDNIIFRRSSHSTAADKAESGGAFPDQRRKESRERSSRACRDLIFKDDSTAKFTFMNAQTIKTPICANQIYLNTEAEKSFQSARSRTSYSRLSSSPTTSEPHTTSSYRHTSEAALKTTLPTNLEFCLDSGASVHLCSDPDAFSTIRKLEKPILLNSVSDEISARYVGEVETIFPNGMKVYLQDVLFVPEIKYTFILSIPRIHSSCSVSAKTLSDAQYR